MRPRSLRFRITVSLLLFVGISSSVFALAIYYVNDRLENQLLDETLEAEFDEFQERYQQGRQLPLPNSSLIRSYLVDAEGLQTLPPPLWSLSPGTHHDIEIDGRAFHVLNRAMGSKRVYILYDISRVERRESRLVLFLILGVLLVSASVVWSGHVMSRYLIAPVTRFADRVSHLDPGQPGSGLAHEFTGVEIEVIARAFDRFLARLAQFVEREHAFAQDASHELRTPLAVINSATELALADPQLPDSTRQPLQRIQRAARQMARLTSALLFLARETDDRADDGESSQVGELVRAVVDEYRQWIADKPVQLQLSVVDSLQLPVPRGYIEIVVANLVQNAIAHTQQGRVRVELKDGMLMVEDTGCGIAAEDLPHIFERHFRGAGSRGIGRGLDLVKRICERHGWHIEVSSSRAQGTRFILNFRG
jgi:signal transduction histidine kinase